MNSDKNTYYVALGDQVFGPYSRQEMLSLGLLPDTLVCHPDTEWVQASECPEFRHLFNRTDDEPRRMLDDRSRVIYEQKRKAALIGVLTLGLAGLAVIGIGETWRSNLFAGTSMDHGASGFILKIISFMIISVVVAVPFFIISLVRLIYYSVLLSSKK